MTGTVQRSQSPARTGPALARFGHWLCDEARHLLPITAYFLVGFILVLTIVKLALAEYSIEISTLSQAVLGALISAKVVVILDRTSLARSFARYPRAIPVLWRTLFYGCAVIVLGFAERVIEQRHHAGGLAKALVYVASRVGFHRLFAIAVGVSLIFCVYFVVTEISEFVGPGVLGRLFFKSNQASHFPNRESIGTGVNRAK